MPEDAKSNGPSTKGILTVAVTKENKLIASFQGEQFTEVPASKLVFTNVDIVDLHLEAEVPLFVDGINKDLEKGFDGLYLYGTKLADAK